MSHGNLAQPGPEVETLYGEIHARLGGLRVTARQVRGEADLVQVVRSRLPLAALEALRQSGFEEEDLGLIVAPRTLRHRRQHDQPLSVEESDRAVRLTRIQVLAERTFGNAAKANRWLHRPMERFDGEAPLRRAVTEVGARQVEELLARIAWGAAA